MNVLADAWIVIGTVAGVVAAVGAVAAVIATIVYGRMTDSDARTAIRYERLREARELLSRIRSAGDNTGWSECNDLCARLGALLPQLGGSLPAAERLVRVRWDLDAYTKHAFRPTVDQAIGEVDAMIAALAA